MFARIYQPARNAMQSGQAKTKTWVLEFEPEQAKTIEPLMGYTGSGDTRGQVRLTFDSQAGAEEYAREHGIPFQVELPNKRKHVIRARGYGENFASGRRMGWTH